MQMRLAEAACDLEEITRFVQSLITYSLTGEMENEDGPEIWSILVLAAHLYVGIMSIGGTRHTTKEPFSSTKAWKHSP